MPFYTPYAEAHLDTLYNLLFCDDLDLFRTPSGKAEGPLAVVLARSPTPDALLGVARDETAEGRIRALAYNRLREQGERVAERIVLGVIVEVALDGGLDTLAAFREGSVRYLNHAGKVAVFEAAPASVTDAARAVVGASERLAEQIGPWEEARLPPPAAAAVRLTLLVSDGLYFGEGPYKVLRGDALGGPVLAAAEHLLESVVDAEEGTRP